MKRRNRSKRSNLRNRLVRAVLWVFVAVLGASVGGLIYVDRLVAKRLTRQDEPHNSAIYSDFFRIDTNSRLSQASLRQALLDRRYREVTKPPASPGEFRIANKRLDIVTREFRATDGNIRGSEERHMPLDSRSDEEPIFLEPQVVTVLGSGEIEARQYTSLVDFPDKLKHAIIAVEDERFYSHHGIDVQGIVRALFINLKSFAWVQGGSTITQQLAKNILFTPERTLQRKILEALAAISLEWRLSKEQILELYLNEVYLGQEGSVALHGFTEAANTFFGKQIGDINLAEAALLAGLVKAPSYYSPRKHLDRALERRNVVLDKMKELGFVSEKEFNLALKVKTSVLTLQYHQRRAPHFTVAVQDQLMGTLAEGETPPPGISIFTGIDLGMQSCAENAVTAGLEKLEKAYPKLIKGEGRLEAGLVAIESYSGKVRAWVGGRDYASNQFDHVVQAKRQIGSTIKPFLYLTALDSSLNSSFVATPITILSDRPVLLDLPKQPDWEPENYDREFRGDVTLRYALENSLNMPAVSLSQRVGIPALVHTTQLFHLSDNIPAVPSLALGAADTNLLSLTAAFGAFANGGRYVAPRLFVSAIDDSDTQVATSPITEQKVASEGAVYVLTNIMQGAVERGTGKGIRRSGFSAPAAGKTGTSNDTRDAWFVGFTPDFVAGVWVGFDNNDKIGLTGGIAAAPIWGDFMQCISSFHPAQDFIPPPGVVFVSLDGSSADRATPDCPSSQIVEEVFVRGTEPIRSCRLHSYTQVEEPPPAEVPFEERREPKKRKRGFWDMLFG